MGHYEPGKIVINKYRFSIDSAKSLLIYLPIVVVLRPDKEYRYLVQ